MNDKFIFSDFDGTLTPYEEVVFEKASVVVRENLPAIRRWIDSGGKFTIATGRSVNAIRSYLETVEVNAPVICLNGAVIYDFDEKTYIKEKILPTGVKELINDAFLRFDDLVCFILTREGAICLGDLSDVPLPTGELEAFDLERLQDAEQGIWYKAEFIIKPRYELEFVEFMREHNKLNCTFIKTDPDCFEILPPDTSKGAAMLELARMKNVAPSKTVAIGDYLNDLEMLKSAGFSATVNNAPDELKEVCDLIVCPPDEGAVKALIDHLMYPDGQ